MQKLKMKQLENLTGVGREAIRFYIREGILPEPEKPKKNVAFYSDEHVKRLLAIKKLQQERDLSLSRIRTLFDSNDNALSLAGMERLLPALVDGVAPAPDCRLADLREEREDIDLTDAELAELEDAGIINIRREADGEAWLDFRDAAVLRKWQQVRKAGFTRDIGYDLHMLKRYHEITDQLAQEEVEQFFASFSGRVNSETASETAAKGIELVNDIMMQLHIRAIIHHVNARLQQEAEG